TPTISASFILFIVVTFRFPSSTRRSPLERRDHVSLRLAPCARVVPPVGDRSFAEFRRSTGGVHSPVGGFGPMSTTVEWSRDPAGIGALKGGFGEGVARASQVPRGGAEAP